MLDDSPWLARSLDLAPPFGLATSKVDASGGDHSPAPPLPLGLLSAVPKRKREFLAGRRCAREALDRAGHPSPVWPGFGENALPVWPAGWHGSISHCDEGAVAVVAPRSACRCLGIDMERPMADAVATEVESHILAPGEAKALAQLPPHLRVTLAFSAKEALFKALYPETGAFEEFSAAWIVAVGEDRLRLRLTHAWGRDWPCGTELEARYAVGSDFVYCLVAPPETRPPALAAAPGAPHL